MSVNKNVTEPRGSATGDRTPSAAINPKPQIASKPSQPAPRSGSSDDTAHHRSRHDAKHLIVRPPRLTHPESYAARTTQTTVTSPNAPSTPADLISAKRRTQTHSAGSADGHTARVTRRRARADRTLQLVEETGERKMICVRIVVRVRTRQPKGFREQRSKVHIRVTTTKRAKRRSSSG